MFGALAAVSTTVNSTTQITAIAPPQAAGSVNVKVSNVDGQSVTVLNGFAYAGGLSITSVTPASGPTAGGTTITINGANFQAGSTVLVGGVAATSVTFVNSGQMTAVTPAHAFGTVGIQISTPGGQTAALGNSYTYLAATPTVTSVSPASGSSAGGTTITITGTNFLSGAAVTLGGVAASSVNVVSSSQITAVTPVHVAGTVAVQVTNGDGQSAPTPGSFTYIAPPVVASVSPAQGPASPAASRCSAPSCERPVRPSTVPLAYGV